MYIHLSPAAGAAAVSMSDARPPVPWLEASLLWFSGNGLPLTILLATTIVMPAEFAIVQPTMPTAGRYWRPQRIGLGIYMPKQRRLARVCEAVLRALVR